MAAILLLPGFGGKYTSESFVDTDTIGVDTIDVSHCAQFAIQVEKVSGTPVGDIQIEQSFDGLNWAPLGAATGVADANDGDITRYGAAAGPYGQIRIDATGLTAGVVLLTIVGFPMQWSF